MPLRDVHITSHGVSVCIATTSIESKIAKSNISSIYHGRIAEKRQHICGFNEIYKTKEETCQTQK